MNSIVITQGILDELDKIAELFDEYRMFYKQEPDFDGAKNFIKDRFIQRDSIIFVAKNQNNQYIGFTQLYPTFSSVSMQKSLILNDLYVREKYRGNGIGKLLLEKAKNYAVQTGSKGLSLATAIENKLAQNLYENQGYIRDTSYYHYTIRV